MTRDEMLGEIDALRQGGHAVGITGHVGDWQCDIDGKIGKGAMPMEAFIAAREMMGEPN